MKILLKNGTEAEVEEKWIIEWCELYWKDDVKIQLMKCRLWNLSNPNNRKTKQGLRKHINNWLARANKNGDCRIRPEVTMVSNMPEEPRPDVPKETVSSALAKMKEIVG